MSEVVFGDLVLAVPEGWRIDHHDDRELVLVFPVTAGPKALAAKATATFMGSVLIERAPGESDLDSVVRDRIEKFQRAQPSVQAVLDEATTAGGLPARVREQTFVGPGRMLYQQRVLYLVAQSTAYIVSTTHLAGAQFSPVRAAFDQFVASLRL